MGTNYKQFSKGLKVKVRDITEEQMPTFYRLVGLDALSRIVLKTPVDTGRARGGWQININAIGEGAKVKSKSGDQVIAAGNKRLSAVKLTDTIYITNSVEYIIPLEFGHSSQSPQGMVRVTVAELGAMFQ